jgi:hypothetical protein
MRDKALRERIASVHPKRIWRHSWLVFQRIENAPPPFLTFGVQCIEDASRRAGVLAAI